MQKGQRFRFFYISAFPIIFCLLFFGIFRAAETRIEENYNQNLLKRLNNRAAFAVAKARNGWSISLQLQKSFRYFRDTFSSKSWNGPGELERNLRFLLEKRLSADCLRSSKIWAFSMENGRAQLLKSDFFEQSTRRIMEKSFSSLCFIRDNRKNPGQSSLESHIKLLNGVFGQNSAPLQLGGVREGIVTPISFAGECRYLLWTVFEDEKGKTGGIIAIFEESFIDDVRNGLRNYADQSFLGSKETLATLFIKASPGGDDLHGVFPGKFAAADQEKKRLVRILEGLLKDESSENLRKVLFRDNYSIYLDYISLELPYYVVVISRLADNPAFFRFRVSVIFVLLSLLWASFIGINLKFSGGKLMNLAVSFKFLFFLTGMLPVAVFLFLGITQISQSKELEIHTRTEDAFAKIERINQGVENISPSIQDYLNEHIYGTEFQRLVLSDELNDHSRAFNLLNEGIKAKGYNLSYLTIAAPGKKMKFICSRPEFKAVAAEISAYVAVSASIVHKTLAGDSPEYEDIELGSEQRKLADHYSSNIVARPEDVILTSLNRVTALQFASNEKSNFFIAIAMRNSTIKAYLAVGINLDEIEANFLEKEFVHSGNLNESFYAIRTGNAGKVSYLPRRMENFSQSEIGRKFSSFVDSAVGLDSRLSLVSGNRIFLISSLSKIKKYHAAGLIDISEIYSQSDLKLVFLFLVAALLGSTIYILAASLSHLAIEPLLSVTEVFNRVAERDFDTGFSYPYNNELGLLAASTQTMISGLKERQLLGKFVSTTLDENGHLDEGFRTARSLNGVVLFSDIRSFTTLSEKHPPEEIRKMLNRHLAEMVEVIILQKGQVEQFIGDAIVAFFPETVDGFAHRALNAAKQMMLNHRKLQMIRKGNEDFTYEIGIGLAYGMVAAGVLSTSKRSEFTILGPARALAENLESESRHGQHTRIIVSQEFAALACAQRDLVQIDNKDYFEIGSLGEAE